MNIIFVIEGGIGKSIMATAVCEAIKNKYTRDKLLVVTAYPEVFICNPHVDKCLDFNHLNYFYSDYIDDKRFQIFAHNPYNENNYFKRDEHLIQTWCEMFGIKYNGEQPELFINQRELDFFQKKYASDKPIFLMQTNGGATKELKYSFARDLPSSVVLKVIEHFAPTHNIVHVRKDDQIGYQNTTPITASFREIIALTLLSQKRLLIDSFLQHCCSALNLPSTVCWITNSPKVLGYELHDNILANPFTKTPELRNSFLSKFNIIGDPIEFPYNNEDEIFDVEKIIASLEK
jgi:hypothetical protein